MARIPLSSVGAIPNSSLTQQMREKTYTMDMFAGPSSATTKVPPVSAELNRQDVLQFAKFAPGSESGIRANFLAPKGTDAVGLQLVLLYYGDGAAPAGNAGFDVTPYVNGVALPVVQKVEAVLNADNSTLIKSVFEILTSVQFAELDEIMMEIDRKNSADITDTYAGVVQLVKAGLYHTLM